MQVASDNLDKFFSISSIVIGVVTMIATVCTCFSVYHTAMSTWIKILIILTSPILWLLSFYMMCVIFALAMIGIASVFDKSIWTSYFGGDVW